MLSQRLNTLTAICLFYILQTIIFAALKKNRKYVLTMQLKGLVRFFALALILICLYQLSFTWMVRSYESSMRDKAELWVKAVYPTAEKKYPGNKALQDVYNDSLQ